LLIDCAIDYGVELGIPYAELDNMKGAYDLWQLKTMYC
jgi:hypothetical protein